MWESSAVGVAAMCGPAGARKVLPNYHASSRGQVFTHFRRAGRPHIARGFVGSTRAGDGLIRRPLTIPTRVLRSRKYVFYGVESRQTDVAVADSDLVGAERLSWASTAQ